MKRNKFVLGSAFIVLSVALATSGAVSSCGKKKGGGGTEETGGGAGGPTLAEGTKIAISGTLAIAPETSSLNLDDPTQDPTKYSVYCVTFSNPPIAGTGHLNPDWSFSVSLEAAQQAVGCFILFNEEQVGTIVFKNPNKKTLSGSAKTEQRQAFSGDTNLGKISLNLTTGQAEVDVTKITTKKDTTTANAAESTYDFSGSYSLEPVSFALPSGYMTACAQGDRECHGPTAGESIWLKRVQGKFLADGKPAYGIMAWQSEAAFQACGSKLGFTYADAKSHAGIDLSQSGVAEGKLNFATDWGSEGWMSPNARLNWDQMKMERATIAGLSGMKQYFKQATPRTCNQSGCTEGTPDASKKGYNFFVQNNETGCKIGDKPYQLKDWSNMQCTFAALGGGLNKNTCTKTENGQTVTCTNIGGMFDLNGNPLNTSGSNTQYNARFPDDYVVYGQGARCVGGQNGARPYWDGNSNGMKCDSGTLTPGDLCSSLAANDSSAPAQLAKYRCYSDAYWRDAEAATKAGKCIRQVQTNWMAERPEDFVSLDGPSKARSQHIFEAFEYDSPNSGSFRSEEKRFDGIKVGDNFDSCEVMEAMTFSMRRIPNSSDLIMEMISEKRNISKKPACIAYYENNGGNAEVQKMMFSMKKK